MCRTSVKLDLSERSSAVDKHMRKRNLPRRLARPPVDRSGSSRRHTSQVFIRLTPY
eukprot:GSChrysophyteH1.ASY1.ANO1.2698.1 assembled CDS